MPRLTHISDLADRDDRLHRTIRLGASAAVGVLALAALLFASLPLKIAAVLFGLCVLQGLWRGASELAGLVVGSLLAIALAPPIARGIEAPVSSLFGTTGLANRFAAMALVAGIIVVVAGTAAGIATRRVMKQHPGWRRWDQYLGGGIGVVEGVILALVTLWVPLALEPIAASQLAVRTEWDEMSAEPPRPPPPAARTIVKLARAVRESPLGGIAAATNPIEGADLLGLAQDFAAVSRDPAAMDHLMNSAVMQEIQATPSVISALERLRRDEEIARVIDARAGVTPDFLRTLVQSATVLRVFDETTVVADLTPLADRLRLAIKEAKAMIGTPPP